MVIMISLMDVIITIFTISTVITIIMIFKVVIYIYRKVEGLSYSDIYEIRDDIEKIRRDFSSHKIKLDLLDAKISNLEGIIKGFGNMEKNIEKVEQETKTIKVESTPPQIIENIKLSKFEVEILKYLREHGQATSSEIGEALGKSREHVSRTLKSLYGKGYVNRIESVKPFRYTLNNERIAEIDRIIEL